MAPEEADRLNQLDPTVKKMLSQMSDDEVATLEYVATIPREELRAMMKFFRDAKAVGWFFRWLILGIIGAFIGAATLGDSIMKMIGWFRGTTH